MGKRFASLHAGLVDQELSRERVGALDDEVIVRDDGRNVTRRYFFIVRDDLHIGIKILNPLPGRLRLRLANVGGTIENLALKVRDFHSIAVRDAQCANTGGSQVQNRR